MPVSKINSEIEATHTGKILKRNNLDLNLDYFNKEQFIRNKRRWVRIQVCKIYYSKQETFCFVTDKYLKNIDLNNLIILKDNYYLKQ